MADTNLPGGSPGTPPPGGAAPPNPGTDDNKPEYVSREDFGKTAALIGGIQKTLKDLPGSLLTLDKLAEVGLLEKVDDAGVISYRPKSSQPKPDDKAKPREADDPLLLRLKSLEGELARKTKAEEEGKALLAESEKRSALTAALTKAGAVNADRDFVHLVGAVGKGEKGFVGKGTDKYGTETELTIDEVAEAFLKLNPELRRAQAQPGSGSPQPGNGSVTAGGGKVIPKAQWSDMNFFVANRAKFHSGEYVRGQ